MRDGDLQRPGQAGIAHIPGVGDLVRIDLALAVDALERRKEQAEMEGLAELFHAAVESRRSSDELMRVILAGALPLGDDPLSVNYTPDRAGSFVLNSASGASLVTGTTVPIGSEAGYLTGERSSPEGTA